MNRVSLQRDTSCPNLAAIATINHTFVNVINPNHPFPSLMQLSDEDERMSVGSRGSVRVSIKDLKSPRKSLKPLFLFFLFALFLFTKMNFVPLKLCVETVFVSNIGAASVGSTSLMLLCLLHSRILMQPMVEG